MKTVWKYPLSHFGAHAIEMPDDAKILCVQTQQGAPCLWALVDSDRPRMLRHLGVYGTGHSLPDDLGRYIGTFQTTGAFGEPLTWHVFDAGQDL